MEKISQSEQKTIREELQAVIKESPQEIEAEMERSGNRWLACIITRLSIMTMMLDAGRRIGQIDTESFTASMDRLNALVHRVREYQHQYEVQDDISDDLKSKLLIALGDIVEDV